MTTRPLFTLLLCAAVWLPLDTKAQRATQAQCAHWEQQLERVQNRLRAGYRGPEGNRLRERRRWLQQQLRQCRHQRPR